MISAPKSWSYRGHPFATPFEARIVLKVPNLKLFFWNLTFLEWPFMSFFCWIKAWNKLAEVLEWVLEWQWLVKRPGFGSNHGLSRKKLAFSRALFCFWLRHIVGFWPHFCPKIGRRQKFGKTDLKRALKVVCGQIRSKQGLEGWNPQLDFAVPSFFFCCCPTVSHSRMESQYKYSSQNRCKPELEIEIVKDKNENSLIFHKFAQNSVSPNSQIAQNQTFQNSQFAQNSDFPKFTISPKLKLFKIPNLPKIQFTKIHNVPKIKSKK